jgi:GAF domain-containing protein
MAGKFSAVVDSLANLSGRESELWRPVLEAIPVEGAAISTIAEFLGNETVSASGPLAARLDELQFDLSEGPCWDAMRQGRPVLEPDVKSHPRRDWPAFSRALAEHEVGAIFAFPLAFGPLQIGAMDLYCGTPRELSSREERQSSILASHISRIVLDRAIRRADEPDILGPEDQFSRRLIHQATGMVLAQLDISPEDARLLIQGHAFAHNRSMRDIAEEILERRLDFSNQADGFESSDD